MEEIKNNFYDCEYTDSELFLLDDLTINEMDKVNNNTNVNNVVDNNDLTNDCHKKHHKRCKHDKRKYKR
jgi:hypothetical protein